MADTGITTRVGSWNSCRGLYTVNFQFVEMSLGQIAPRRNMLIMVIIEKIQDIEIINNSAIIKT